MDKEVSYINIYGDAYKCPICGACMMSDGDEITCPVCNYDISVEEYYNDLQGITFPTYEELYGDDENEDDSGEYYDPEIDGRYES